MRVRLLRWLTTITTLVGFAQPVLAQATANAAPTDSVLSRQIALHVTGVRLDAGLDALQRAAGIRLVYDPRSVPVSRLVSLDTVHISAIDALHLLLRDAAIEIVPGPSNEVMLVRTTGRERLRASVNGTVTDSTSGAAVSGADVALSGAVVRHTRTSGEGHYGFAGVDPGRYTMIVRAVGYTQATRDVVVPADTAVRVDVTLPRNPAVLDQVVTTATGDQRLRALGNNIATISVADSVVGNAPVTSLSEVIAARASGVQVFVNGGLTGASPTINIRGQNSANLANQPLLVIDGVRVDNSAATDVPIIEGSAFPTGELTGRFDDLIPEEIESIEIVKGPSAATLYGTDAANGVIVVTTKHGQAGRPQWTVFGENGLITFEPGRFPENYMPWGHPIGQPKPASPYSCPLDLVGEGVCVQDSVTQFTPIRDPSLTPIGTGHRSNYGAQLSGGAGQTRYFLSGTLEDETGYLKMPQQDLEALQVSRGSLGVASDEIHPNGVDKTGGRTNLTTPLGSNADVAMTVSILSQDARIPGAFSLFGAGQGQGYPNAPNEGWGSQQRPSQLFVIRNEQDATHFTGSVSPSWRPATWLSVRGTGGIDYAGESLDHLERTGEGFANPLGYREVDRTTSGTYTADGSATATVPVTPTLTSRTSVGAQYTHQAVLLTQAIGQDLAPGSTTVAGGAIQSSGEQTTEAIIAGGYVEETGSLSNRLFLTAALRGDGASTFGNGFRAALYPKGSASWLVSEEPFWPRNRVLSSLRVRAAYGASGVQPPSGAALVHEALEPVFVDGQPTTGTNLGQLANPDLKPERQQEFETGADLDFWHQRVHVEGTYYRKQSSDAIVPIPISSSLGGANGLDQFVNIGDVLNWGYEGLVRVDVIDTRDIAAEIALNGSLNNNRLISLGAGAQTPAQIQSSGSGSPGNALGYPLGSYFDLPITSFADANHDGIIEPNEITLGGPAYVGSAYPKSQITATAGITLVHRHLHISAQFDHRGGFVLLDPGLFGACAAETCPQGFERGTPLALQAQAVNAQNFFADGFSYAGFFEDGSFTRFRELSATWSLSDRVARMFHSRSATIMLAGRNLALWTHYRGVDPEVQAFLSGGVGAQGAYSTPAAPIPVGTYWIARVTLGF
jgi:TonB-dependent SusC/RagA subfamily outer membrane receptor